MHRTTPVKVVEVDPLVTQPVVHNVGLYTVCTQDVVGQLYSFWYSLSTAQITLCIGHK